MTAPNLKDASKMSLVSGRLPSSVLWIGGGCILVELVLQAADLGLIGSPLWRSMAYQNGAFWPGLLQGWKPNYFAQPVTMFITYAFLHGSIWHLAGNMIALLALGRVAEEHVGQKKFVLIYVMSAFGGAAAFGTMAFGPQPMVGASGALFGLAGAWQYWDYTDSRRSRRRVRHLFRSVGVLVVLNVALWILLEGALAWQTHLGGFLTGWIVAAGLHRQGEGRRN
jgi:membrane associated rhomboid family serine protease